MYYINRNLHRINLGNLKPGQVDRLTGNNPHLFTLSQKHQF